MSIVKASEQINRYSELVQPALRDQIGSFVTNHMYLVIRQLAEQFGENPYPSDKWQFWDNLIVDSKAQKKHADLEVSVQKTKVDPNDPKKKIKIDGEYITKKQRLRKIATHNAQGKNAWVSLLIKFVSEADAASDDIRKNGGDIKNAIINHSCASPTGFSLSNLIIAANDAYDEKVIQEMIPRHHGELVTKLGDKVYKYITHAEIKHVVVQSFIRLLELYVIDKTSSLWYKKRKVPSGNSAAAASPSAETKSENGDAEGEGKGQTIDDGDIIRFIGDLSTKLLRLEDKLGPDAIAYLKEMHSELTQTDRKRKDENKKKRSETAERKRQGGGTKSKGGKKDVIQGFSNSGDEADDPDADVDTQDGDDDGGADDDYHEDRSSGLEITKAPIAPAPATANLLSSAAPTAAPAAASTSAAVIPASSRPGKMPPGTALAPGTTHPPTAAAPGPASVYAPGAPAPAHIQTVAETAAAIEQLSVDQAQQGKAYASRRRPRGPLS